MQVDETKQIIRTKLMKTKTEMPCMEKVDEAWTELRWFTSTDQNGGSLPVPTLHTELRLKSHAFDMGRSPSSQRILEVILLSLIPPFGCYCDPMGPKELNNGFLEAN